MHLFTLSWSFFYQYSAQDSFQAPEGEINLVAMTDIDPRKGTDQVENPTRDPLTASPERYRLTYLWARLTIE